MNKKIITFFSFKEFLTQQKKKGFNLALNSLRSTKGLSYIINLDRLINSKVSDIYKFDYLYLASLRNYIEYYYYADNSLNRIVTSFSDDQLSRNPIITFDSERIYFKLEE